jgi:hypothetical protein
MPYSLQENAVKTQLWIAVSVYVFVVIVRKELQLDASLYTLPQILSVTVFEKMPLQQALIEDDQGSDNPINPNQLNLLGV